MTRVVDSANGSPTVASLRHASGVLRTALARLGQEPGIAGRQTLIAESRAHLVAALHLVDGVGMALTRDVR